MSESAPHIVRSFAQELQHLRDLMSRMGGIVENQVALATQALVDQDQAAATRAVEQDVATDALERETEAFVIRMLARRSRSPATWSASATTRPTSPSAASC